MISSAAHIFCREVPEIPYVYSFNGSLRTTSPTVMAAEFRKSCGILVLFILSTSMACLMGVRSENHTVHYHYNYFTNKIKISSIVLTVLFVAISTGSSLLSITVTPNDYLHRRENKVALFPFISFFVLVLLLLILAAAPLRAWLALSAWIILSELIPFLLTSF